MLEGEGIPTVNVVSDAFVDLFHLEREQQGVPHLPYVVVPHPIGGRAVELVDEMAAAVVDEAHRLLCINPSA
jgi:hypothetical protein